MSAIFHSVTSRFHPGTGPGVATPLQVSPKRFNLFSHSLFPTFSQIITFDDYGVSGHKNHISIYKAMRRLIDNRNLSRRVAVYTLDSVKLFRKYIFIFDLLWSVLTRKLVFVSGLKTVRKSQVYDICVMFKKTSRSALSGFKTRGDSRVFYIR